MDTHSLCADQVDKIVQDEWQDIEKDSDLVRISDFEVAHGIRMNTKIDGLDENVRKGYKKLLKVVLPGRVAEVFSHLVGASPTTLQEKMKEWSDRRGRLEHILAMEVLYKLCILRYVKMEEKSTDITTVIMGLHFFLNRMGREDCCIL